MWFAEGIRKLVCELLEYCFSISCEMADTQTLNNNTPTGRTGMTIFYFEYDPESGSVTNGPTELPPELIELDLPALALLNWYPAQELSYDIGELYNINAYDIVDGPFCTFDADTQSIKRLVICAEKPLIDVQTYVTQQLTEYRNNLFDAGFIFGGVEFDSDKDSRLNWTAAVTSVHVAAYMNALPFSSIDLLPVQNWTRKDNRTALFAPSELITCGLALGQWASDCFQYCRELKTEVINADTFAEVWGAWLDNDLSDWPSNDFGGALSLEQPLDIPDYIYELPSES